MDECKRGCCWTPHQVCAKQRTCEHHVSSAKAQEYKEMTTEAAAEIRRGTWKR